jgi:deoxyribose-phosphate aldolase
VIKLASYIDHTILKPATTHIEIEKICKEAVDWGFAAVCVPPPFVEAAGALLRPPPPGLRANVDKGFADGTLAKGEGAGFASGGKGGAGVAEGKEGAWVAEGKEGAWVEGQDGRAEVKVATVIGFPFGYSTIKAKLAEVEQAIADGADELDIVINLIALKEGRWALLEEEMKTLVDRAHAARKLVKVIIESGILKDEEIIRCCQLYAGVGVDFLKTSTGYAEKGATIGAVQLMRAHLPKGIRIKASGGIRDAGFALQLIAAGADRLGCSASVEIVRQAGEHAREAAGGKGTKEAVAGGKGTKEAVAAAGKRSEVSGSQDFY